MSLRDGRYMVTVWPRSVVEDEYGLVGFREGDPVTVQATVKWQSPVEVGGLVISPGSEVAVIARMWPGSEQCRFTWNGYVFEQVGPTRHFSGSPLTEHDQAQGRLIAQQGGGDDERT